MSEDIDEASDVDPTGHAGDDMHIHKPKAAHSLREFLGEISVIVVGIVIALGLEQAVEQVHWRNEVSDARRSLHTEIEQNSAVFAFRVAIAPCVAKRLDTLAAVTEKVATHGAVPRLGSVMPDTGDALHDNIWEAHRAAQTLTHFSADELERLSTYYQQLSYVRVGLQQESDTENVLRIVEGDATRLGPPDVANLRIAIQRARFVNGVLAMISRQQLATSKQLGVTAQLPNPSRISELCNPLPSPTSP